MADAPQRHPRRRTFGPVVLLGLAGAALAAVSASRTWVSGSLTSASSTSSLTMSFDPGESPLAAALALVLLAAWGVVLVTRGRFRRAVCLLGAAAALGFAVTTALAPWQLRRNVEEAMRFATGTTEQDLGVTAWWWAAVVAAVVACATSVASVLWVRHWPEMGTRYDAPAGSRAPDGARTADPADTADTNIDIWKALDEGRDPTA